MSTVGWGSGQRQGGKSLQCSWYLELGGSRLCSTSALSWQKDRWVLRFRWGSRRCSGFSSSGGHSRPNTKGPAAAENWTCQWWCKVGERFPSTDRPSYTNAAQAQEVKLKLKPTRNYFFFFREERERGFAGSRARQGNHRFCFPSLKAFQSSQSQTAPLLSR